MQDCHHEATRRGNATNGPVGFAIGFETIQLSRFSIRGGSENFGAVG